jgi:hypothetical protein
MLLVGAHADYRCTSDDSVEIVALHLFNLADRNGQLITRAWCDRRLDELRAHPQGCRCDAPCQVARDLPARKIWWCATEWQSQIAQSRRLARR